jgi:galactitol-specific phosphotransferase system IIB component
MAGKAAVKRIIVACGWGVASSTISAERMQDLLRKWGVKGVRIDVIDYKSAKNEAERADLFVNIAPTRDITYACPQISGVPFMTGFGMEEHMKKILAMIGISVGV